MPDCFLTAAERSGHQSATLPHKPIVVAAPQRYVICIVSVFGSSMAVGIGVSSSNLHKFVDPVAAVLADLTSVEPASFPGPWQTI